MAADKGGKIQVRQHVREWPGIDERTGEYLAAIIDAGKAEGLDDKAALRIALAFLKAYRPRVYLTALGLAQKAGLV